MAAAASAVNPIAAPPQPGTAVKDPARSIVSRMKRRLSAARSSRGTRTGRGDRAGSAGGIDLRGYARTEGCQVLCTTESSRSTGLRFPAIPSNEGNKATMVKGALTERFAVLLHTQEPLLIRGSHRENQTAAFCELRR